MIGQTISHYRLTAELGTGGMGVVYEAEDLRLGRRVAVKILADEARRSPETMERFRREARIVSSLSHPHIAVLHDFGEHAGEQFMVMELLEGESLKARIARGALPIDEVLDLGAQIADALEAAHAQSIVHRDIKPANLFITRRGRIKVLDFGVAKLAERPKRVSDTSATLSGDEGLTTVGTTLGTVSYMSPEQARGHDTDARSDLFSLGVVLYEMATGRSPFQGATAAVIFEGILTKTPPAPSTIDRNVPPELDRIIARALEKDRDARYQSASEMRADLERLERDTDVSRAVAAVPRPPERPVDAPSAPALTAPVTAAPHRRRAWLFGAPIATAAIVGAAVLWQSTRAPALTSRDPVVLADFMNRTGDTMFDATLAEALALQLRQSPFLNLLPEQQVQATLRLMGLEPMAAITPEIGRDLCQRVGAKALLGGSIAGLGSSYVLTVNAQDCVTGETLAEEQVQATNKEAVLTELGAAAARLRERLGESLPSVQKYGMRIEEATTGSLDALKAYSQGIAARRTQGDFESIPFFRRAVALDPEFALAYARLGTVMSNAGVRAEAVEYTQKAFDLRGRASERERLYIEARYYSVVERDMERAIDTYRLLTATYPNDHAGHTNLALLYKDLGRAEQAVAELEETVRIAPSEPLGPFNLGYAYLDLGELEEARKAFEQALAIRDGTEARVGMFVIGILSGNPALADAQVAAVRGRRDAGAMIGIQSVAAAYAGRLRQAEELTAQWLRQLDPTPHTDIAGQGLIGLATSMALWGRPAVARRMLADGEQQKIVGLDASDEMIGLAAALGDTKLAQAWLDRALVHAKESVLPEELTSAQAGLRGTAALAAGRDREAYDLVSTVTPSRKMERFVFVLGVAAMRTERWDDARKAFEAIAKNRGRNGLDPTVPIAQLFLAKTYARLGDTAAARRTYDEAFAHLKEADADLPLLLDARREYAKLGT